MRRGLRAATREGRDAASAPRDAASCPRPRSELRRKVSKLLFFFLFFFLLVAGCTLERVGKVTVTVAVTPTAACGGDRVSRVVR